jgi:hypothetical protein
MELGWIYSMVEFAVGVKVLFVSVKLSLCTYSQGAVNRDSNLLPTSRIISISVGYQEFIPLNLELNDEQSVSL